VARRKGRKVAEGEQARDGVMLPSPFPGNGIRFVRARSLEIENEHEHEDDLRGDFEDRSNVAIQTA
jgi:hypothetical protein